MINMANFNFNRVIMAGRLTGDPELRQTPTGVPVATASIAVNRKPGKDGEQQTDFFNIVAWRNSGEILAKYFRKGSSVALMGSVQTRSYTNNSGVKVYITEIIADEVYFVDSKSDNADKLGFPETPSVVPHFEDLADDDNLPF
jgi:single-strand DNA-binding protein